MLKYFSKLPSRDLETMSVAELRELATNLQIDVSDAVEKSDMIFRLMKFIPIPTANTPTCKTTQSLMESKPVDPICLVCGHAAKSFCSTCRLVRYCSRECQKKDWSAHKRVCLSRPQLGRFIVVTAALDLERIFPNENIPQNSRFLIAHFLPLSDVNKQSCSLQYGGMQLCENQNIGIILQYTQAILDSYLKHLTVDQLFVNPLVVNEEALVDMAMPIGIEEAVDRWVDEATKMFRAIHDQAPSMLICDRINKAVNMLVMKAMQNWVRTPIPGSCRKRQPGPREDAEAVRFADSFMQGVSVTVPYPLERVPIGSTISLMHFSHGAFFGRLDIAAGRKGLTAERLLRVSPNPFVFDCRTMRKLEEQDPEALKKVKMSVLRGPTPSSSFS